MKSTGKPFANTNKRKWIAILLLLSCTASLVLLATAEPIEQRKVLTNASQIDSLITVTLQDFRIPNSQIRTQTVAIDSVFSRTVYTVRVPSQFSKTSFHLRLHEHVWPYSVQTSGTVQFPERNLRIHLLYNNNVLRSVHLNTDTRLNLSGD
ncbi:MAG: hypothetical protein EA391_07050 [Balneolaceae bacterium]|nr:MAG: hypothetical protein EA391_07050 [Balneolaceae bacterium]